MNIKKGNHFYENWNVLIAIAFFISLVFINVKPARADDQCSYIASGFGNSNANGTYDYAGNNNYPYYYNGTYNISRNAGDASTWYLSPTVGGGGGFYYYNSTADPDPPSNGSWTVGTNATGPAGTVAQSCGGGEGGGSSSTTSTLVSTDQSANIYFYAIIIFVTGFWIMRKV